MPRQAFGGSLGDVLCKHKSALERAKEEFEAEQPERPQPNKLLSSRQANGSFAGPLGAPHLQATAASIWLPCVRRSEPCIAHLRLPLHDDGKSICCTSSRC
mmetsp:Transcript_10755/g.39492  ORF Transcript_10755/g.39492 Transcript_10755/m.39492 type:complete len:101 (-) Transcript_10755:718-1020(-)